MPFTPTTLAAAIIAKAAANVDAAVGGNAMATYIAGNAAAAAYIDGLIASFGYQAQDQQAWTNATVSLQSWVAFGPTYTFNAPIAKTYLVQYRCQGYLSTSGGNHGLYARVRNNTTGISYDSYPQFWKSPGAPGGAACYVNPVGEVPMPMNAGNNIITMELLADTGTTWSLNGLSRAFLIRG